MSRWLLLTGLLINNIYSQTYDADTDYQWNYGHLNCTSYSCSIYCDEYQSCYQSTVNAIHTNQLTITCSEYWSCRSMDLYANYTQTLTINCEYSGACGYMNIYAQNAGTLYFNSYTATSGVNLFVQNISSINIDCNTTKSCDSMNVYAKNAASVTVTAKHDESWSYGHLYADNADSVSLQCASKKYESACIGISWYLSPRRENVYINCYGTGCKSNNNILTEYSVTSLEYDLYINGCGECNNVGSDSCAQFSFLCIPSGSTDSNGYFASYSYEYKDTFYAGSCDGDYACHCEWVEINYVWRNERNNPNCILSVDTTTPNPSIANGNTTPRPTGLIDIIGKDSVYTAVYYIGGLYTLLVLIVSICFAVIGHKDKREDKRRKEVWVHANNQRKQNKKNSNYVYSDVTQLSAMPSESALPEGWRIGYTKDHKEYYQNDITKETRWERPCVKTQIEEEEKKYDNEDVVLADGWRKMYTKDSKSYYQNDITKEMSWERPKRKVVANRMGNVEMRAVNKEARVENETCA